MTAIEFNKYCWLLNRIAYWLVVNKKNVFTANEYNFFGKSKTLKEIKQIINKNGTNYDSDVFVTRFVEYAIMHTNTYGNFPTSVYSMNNKSKLSREQYIQMVKTVWEYERKNKKHPLTVPIPPIKTYKKYGHATSPGCDNRGQNNSVNCGPHSMQEVIRNLTGKVIKQSTLAAWAGTGSGGTDHHGLETAIAKAAKQLGVKFTVKWYNFSDLGWNGIDKIIKSNNQDCIIHNCYRLKWGHYEVVNSISGSNVKVQNSLGNQGCGSCYCGYVEDRSATEFRNYINGISQKSVMVITRVD